ncbi:hypothetical protein HAX54_008077 [Datura stramonium]|uniref:Uncharacterized protein n=1 Tax=Datura stramonium TaxID=4076 RepID=A0ABS8TEI0_DATST|nr:hypothetical protein [Datura stramonium]
MVEQTLPGTALEKPKPTSAMGNVHAEKKKMAEPPWPRTILGRASGDVCFSLFTLAFGSSTTIGSQHMMHQ